MFTQDFFTENATHKQNCTSFDPNRVITHNLNNGKPFLNVSRSAAQIQGLICHNLHSNALTCIHSPYVARSVTVRVDAVIKDFFTLDH
ncbi:hypothetical protein C6560_07100 [Enterobacter sp. FS01]|nr:hypothetical protein C6560_07100 [Enterobacter sp. FS01]